MRQVGAEGKGAEERERETGRERGEGGEEREGSTRGPSVHNPEASIPAHTCHLSPTSEPPPGKSPARADTSAGQNHVAPSDKSSTSFSQARRAFEGERERPAAHEERIPGEERDRTGASKHQAKGEVRGKVVTGGTCGGVMGVGHHPATSSYPVITHPCRATRDNLLMKR